DSTVSESEEINVNKWMYALELFCEKSRNGAKLSDFREYEPFIRRLLLRVLRRLLTKTQLLDILESTIDGIKIKRLGHRFPWRDTVHTEYEPEKSETRKS